MILNDIKQYLNKNKNKTYADFQSKLIPNIDKNKILGVKTPLLKILSKQLYLNKEISIFYDSLPHKYFEENQLHSFIISEEKNFEKCIKLLNIFLEYLDNWATCDQLNPKCFKKNKKLLLKYIKIWLKSNNLYVVRFGIKNLMQYYLDDDIFNIKYLQMIVNIKYNNKNIDYKFLQKDKTNSEYYVGMMIAWFFQVALVKQYDDSIIFLENKKLNNFIHNTTIQKCIDSFRLNNNQKKYLKSLKIK